MFLPPPGSTLFPYTTLFRSFACAERAQKLFEKVGDRHRLGRLRTNLAYAYFRLDRHKESLACSEEARFVRDRKSTRLNSSHRCISYAVFCLKKKNNTTHNIYTISSQDICIGLIKVNFPAPARRQHDSIRTDRINLSRFFIHNLNSKTVIFCY